jgi:hypothetical protein
LYRLAARSRAAAVLPAIASPYRLAGGTTEKRASGIRVRGRYEDLAGAAEREVLEERIDLLGLTIGALPTASRQTSRLDSAASAWDRRRKQRRMSRDESLGRVDVAAALAALGNGVSCRVAQKFSRHDVGLS